VVLASLPADDQDEMNLVRELRREAECEILLMTDHPTLGRAVEAMRLGVRDLFTKPFDMGRLTTALEEAIEARRHRRQERLRYERLRRVSARILRERRTLRQRVDLVCRDLVGAYRRLAEKVVAQRG
jgi:DNA-binding NtrC family response regulator